mmetsp:Transcript_35924/g.75547  ORF Transcript_35924/g.75547 Transcript_35924/m.75547 type:complete len:140 (+) Transcript_35924:529-948(+)
MAVMVAGAVSAFAASAVAGAAVAVPGVAVSGEVLSFSTGELDTAAGLAGDSTATFEADAFVVVLGASADGAGSALEGASVLADAMISLGAVVLGTGALVAGSVGCLASLLTGAADSSGFSFVVCAGSVGTLPVGAGCCA